MGLLDDAIREHLDLKRKHGARDTELKDLESDAFGGGDRPDPFAPGEPPPRRSRGRSRSRLRSSSPTRLRHLRPRRTPTRGTAGRGRGAPGAAEPPEGLREPEPEPDFAEPAPSEPLTPEPSTEPPLDSESLEDLMAEEEPASLETGEPSGAPLEPSEDVPAEPLSPESGVPEPPPPPPEPGSEPPGRARGRVHIPTQEHRPEDLVDEPEFAPEPSEPVEPPEEAPEGEAKPELFDFETDEAAFPDISEPAEAPEDDFEALGPATDEELEDEPFEEEPEAAAPAVEEHADEEPSFEDTAVREPAPAPEADDEPDILSESPEFADEGTRRTSGSRRALRRTSTSRKRTRASAKLPLDSAARGERMVCGMIRLTLAVAMAAVLVLTVGVGSAGAHKRKTDRQTTVTFEEVTGPANDIVSGQVSLGRAPEEVFGAGLLAQAAGAGNCLAGQPVLVKHTLTPEGGGAAPAQLVKTVTTGPTGEWQATYEASGANLGMFDTFQIEVAKTRLPPKNARHKHVCKGAYGNKTVFSY